MTLVPANSRPVDPTAAVDSVFTRTGAVVAVAGDYTAALVTNAADKSSASAQTFTGVVDAAGLGTTIPYLLVQTGAPTVYTKPLVYDNTAVTGGLYSWSGVAYVKIGGLVS